MNMLRGILASLLLVLNTVAGCTPLYLMGAIRPLLKPDAQRNLRQRMDGIIDFWVANNRRVFQALKLTRLELIWDEAPAGLAEDNRELSPERWYLVVSNHQSWTDIIILQNALWGRIPPIKFFTKRQLIWVPFLGIAMWLLGFPYVRRMSREQIAANPQLAEIDRQATQRACGTFRDHPTTVLNFLEGTRFTTEKHTAQASRFRHLLNPKIGGLTYVIDGLRDELHMLLDITIVYQGEVPSFWDMLQGRCPDVQVLIQRRPLPAALRKRAGADETREQIAAWVETIWTEKDRRLNGLEIQHSPLRVESAR